MPRITVIAGRGHNPSATRERQQGPDFCPGAQEAGSHPEGRRMWREAVAAVGGGLFFSESCRNLQVAVLFELG